MSSDTLTADDLDELEDAPAAVASPIDPATSEDVPSSAPAADVDADEAPIEAEPEPESTELDLESYGEEVESLNRALEVSNRKVSKARAAYEAALAENSEINGRLGKVLMAASDIPLHVLNRLQDRITRPEDHKRQTAAQAIRDFQNHFRPGKRDYPVHPSARPLVEKSE